MPDSQSVSCPHMGRNMGTAKRIHALPNYEVVKVGWRKVCPPGSGLKWLFRLSGLTRCRPLPTKRPAIGQRSPKSGLGRLQLGWLRLWCLI